MAIAVHHLESDGDFLMMATFNHGVQTCDVV